MRRAHGSRPAGPRERLRAVLTVTGFVWLAAATPALSAPMFSGPSQFDAGDNPVSVVAADVNADGKPDLITANFSTIGAGGNTILINTTPANAATPSFSGPTVLAAGTNPYSVVAADVNADGKPDLITANYSTNGAGDNGNTILINTTPANAATPSFSGPTAFDAGAFPYSVVAADVNADGKPDLITANYITNGAGGNTILINTTPANAATPSFSGPTPFAAGTNPNSVVAADVNADGKPDLITANYETYGAGGNTILINTTPANAATPSFSGPTAFHAGDNPVSVVAADVNADGKPDLITANLGTNGPGGNTILINTTNAGETTPSFSGPAALAAGTNPNSVVAADVNADGKPDLITANYETYGAGGNTILINTTTANAATPSFSGPTPFAAGDNPYSVVAADVNADGKPDLITANFSTNGAGGNTILINTTANAAPVAVDDAYSVVGGGTLTVPAPGVLGNDTGPDNDPLTAQLDSTTTQGTLTLNPNGSFTYVAPDGAAGSDSFTYHANDGTSDSNTATVTITIQAGCAGRRPTQTGTAGNDTLGGSGANDVILGLGGNDTIEPGSGTDIVCAGPGNDNVRAGSGNDIVRGGSGNDTLDGGSGNDMLFGEAGIDRLLGGGDDDALDGGADSPDRCDGEGGSDTATAGCEVTVSL